MNNITAALGLAQIERADNQIYRKRRINTWYRENLSDLTSIRFQEESLGTKSICWLTSFSLLNESRVSRDQLIEILKVNKIDSRPTFPAISQYPIWGYDPQVQSVAKVIGEGGINLPSGVLISKAAVDKVCEVILQTLSK
jgi:perosamine synthetase